MANVKKLLKLIVEQWCNKHRIYIYCSAITNAKCKIIIDFQGKQIVGTKIYKSTKIGANDDKWWNEITKLRMFYYDKFVNHPDYQ